MFPGDPETGRICRESIAREREDFEKELAAHERRMKSYRLRERIRELGMAAIAGFSGAPDELMKTGAQIAGICCICGRALTDPTSMRLGIWPECRGER